MKLKIINSGLTAYSEALKIQEEVHSSVLSGGADTLILCEHPHVFTLGKSANKSNILIDKNILSTINAEIHQTERGGDVTYHGPGQLVGYPIINLRKHGIGVKKYVETLESSIIKTLSKYGVLAYQIDNLTGIWVGKENEVKRKIGALGIRVRNGVSMHGFALNVTTDLSYFSHIVPCGITDKTVTSIQNEIKIVKIDDFAADFVKTFNDEWEKTIAL